MSMTLEQAIEQCERFANFCVYYNLTETQEEVEQLVDWLRELQERRKRPETIRCKDCKHYHTDVFGQELGIEGIYGNLIVAHNACDKWTKDMNCVTPDGFCFLAERRTDAAK